MSSGRHPRCQPQPASQEPQLSNLGKQEINRIEKFKVAGPMRCKSDTALHEIRTTTSFMHTKVYSVQWIATKQVISAENEDGNS